tara:strand:- start:583 stop:1104 length:522 start_codon:yes stop_codon:yes gene_type:complete
MNILLRNKSKKSEQVIQKAYDEFFRWGGDSSSYRIWKYHPINNGIIDIKDYFIYMIMAERYAISQLRLDPLNKIYVQEYCKKKRQMTWREGYKIIMPELREEYYDYAGIFTYVENHSIILETIMGILLTSNRIDAFRNFGWKIASYLRYNSDFYKQMTEIEHNKKLKLIKLLV